MTDTRKVFSRNLKRLRLLKGFSQNDLANVLGISLRYIQVLESKEPPNIKLDTLEALAKALEVSPKDFFDD